MMTGDNVVERNVRKALLGNENARLVITTTSTNIEG